MGYKIKVDHSKFDTAASAIETFNSNINTKMGKADKAVTTMLSSWKGLDASTFKTKWDTVNDRDSTYGKMKKSLESYAGFLRAAGSKYKNAQANAINRANRLPKW